MFTLEKIKIRTGLMSVLVLFFVALIASTLLASFDAKRTYEGVQHLNLVSVEQVDPLRETYGLLMRTRLALSGSFQEAEDGHGDLSKASLQRALGFLQDAGAYMQRYLAVPKSEEAIRRAREVEDAYKAYVVTIDLQVGSLASGHAAKYIQANLEARQANAVFEAAMRNYFDHTAAVGSEELMAAERRYSISLLTSGILVLFALFLLAACAYFVLRGVLRPLQEATAQFDRMAQGDLTTHINVRSNNEIGLLMAALSRMREGLTDVIGRVRSAAQEIDAGSGEIASGNTDLSARTEQQAASLQETAASMEELDSTVKQNVDNAHLAKQLAEQSRDIAQRGGQTVRQAVLTMDAISGSSQKVAEIVAVIDSIAFQTNILALNAAVEAARAGEQGKGFAVVASEVRNLAQRSAHAAKEIKDLIDDSLEKVSAGSQQVGDAGSTMAEIVASVERVTNIMGQITAASDEQASGIHQVNVAVSQMDTVTQQNAALVEQAAAATASLNEQAHQLVEAMAFFRITAGQLDVKPQGGGALRLSSELGNHGLSL